MAPQESAGDEKTYRFISDPTHKESLSGRVRAACVTCRRKKIKCSGDVPCNTCEEKGLVCEGLTERKRPTRNVEPRRTQNSSASTKRKSISLDHRAATVDGSGCLPSSSKTNSLALPISPVQRTMSTPTTLDTNFVPNKTVRPRVISPANGSRASSTQASPLTGSFNDWNFATVSGASTYCPTETTGSDISHSTQVPSPADAIPSMDWPEADNRDFWYRHNSTGSPATSNLISAARALEEQAQSLRRMALTHESDVMDEARRQTIAFPIQPANNASLHCSEYLHSNAFDDLNLVLGDHSLNNGMTQMDSDIASWVDMNPELATALHLHPTSRQAHHNSRSPIQPIIENSTAQWHYGADQSQQPATMSQPQVLPQGPAPDRRSINTSLPFTDHHSLKQRQSHPMNDFGRLYPEPG